MSESQQSLSPNSDDDGLYLRELLGVIWEGKWLIGGITFVSTAIAVVVALVLPNIYRADALLAPNEQDGAAGLSSLAAQYGGLASLAGIDIGSGSNDKTASGLEILKSRKFITEFIERHEILVPLMAAKGWDSETGELVIDSDDYDLVAGKWIRDVRPPKKTIPSLQEAYEEFMDIFTVSQDKKTNFVTVSIEHYSPMIAKEWVDWLVDDLNSTIMLQEIAEAEQAIEYLNEQIDNTSLAQMQNVFFSLIEEQTKTVMLAKVSNEYLLKTLDPAMVPEKKAKPNRALIVVISTMMGFFLVAIGVLFRSPPNRRKQGT